MRQNRGWGTLMFKRLFVACGLLIAITSCTASPALAAGPFGTIHVGNWIGGAFTDDSTGAFSHCGASASFVNGTFLTLGRNVRGYWIIGFLRSAWNKTPGQAAQVDITFDGQSQLRLFGSVVNRNLM